MVKNVIEYVAKHRDDALICAAFVALFAYILIG